MSADRRIGIVHASDGYRICVVYRDDTGNWLWPSVGGVREVFSDPVLDQLIEQSTVCNDDPMSDFRVIRDHFAHVGRPNGYYNGVVVI